MLYTDIFQRKPKRDRAIRKPDNLAKTECKKFSTFQNFLLLNMEESKIRCDEITYSVITGRKEASNCHHW